jgi:DNA-directed RNA polymerase specialized sigma24 family protein
MPRKKQNSTTLFKHAPASRESNDALYPLVVAGNLKAREEMILSNMPMVTRKVSAYLFQFPQCKHLKDDLLSQGYVGLVTAVNNMVGGQVEEPNPTGFMSMWIHREIGELLDYESAIRVPKRSYLRKKKADAEFEVPTKEASIDADYTLDKDGDRDPRSMVDFFDEIIGCCETQIEEQIVKHRVEGRTDAEIAVILGLPKTTTYMMRRDVYDRFLERNPEIKGEV